MCHHLCVRWFGAVLGHTVTRTLPFWIAGAMLGLGIGAATMWVQVSVSSWHGSGQSMLSSPTVF